MCLLNYLPSRKDFPVLIAPATDMIDTGRSLVSVLQNILRTSSSSRRSRPSEPGARTETAEPDIYGRFIIQ